MPYVTSLAALLAAVLGAGLLTSVISNTSEAATVRVAPVAAVVEGQPLPPAARVEVVPARPAPLYLWVPGHWAWRGARHGQVWVPGRWVLSAHRRHAWAPGYWVASPAGSVWVEGR